MGELRTSCCSERKPVKLMAFLAWLGFVEDRYGETMSGRLVRWLLNTPGRDLKKKTDK